MYGILFEATLRSESIHALQHLSFLGSGVLFWWALLTFSSRLWYPLYASNTDAWGITPLEDQQLAGLIMWAPAGLAYLIATLAISASWLTEKTERPSQPGRAAAGRAEIQPEMSF